MRSASCTSAIVGLPSPPPSGCSARVGGRRRRGRRLCRRAGGDPQRQRTAGQLPQLPARQPFATAAARVGSGSTTRGDRRPRLGAGDSPVFEDPERYVEADTVARAFASLSPRWQQTLWLTEVEQRSACRGRRPSCELAPNATAALTHRAREAFATAYLAEHIDSAPDEACERYAPTPGGLRSCSADRQPA